MQNKIDWRGGSLMTLTWRTMTICLGVLLLSSATILHGQTQTQSQEKIDFNRQIRPILSDRCYLCHGPDDGTNESGVRLDIESEAIDASVWVPHQPDESSLIKRIESDDPSSMMPPPDANLTLSAKEKKLLRRWIEQGANYDKHWAFKTLPGTVDVPALPSAWSDEARFAAWKANPIDAFVARKIKASKLQPAEPAEKQTWLRRVTFDLTGLPPTEGDIKEFLLDDSDNAFEKVTDRLLTSKHFGKRMATNWLDAVRYADSYGYQSDQLTSTWPYRDWVVNAINENLPYDQFLKWQIAGDLIPNPNRQQRLATAFNRLHRQTNEGGSVQLEWQTEYVADRVNTFGTAVLGLTLECARCHDHKYDPVSHQDYYNMFSFFNSVDEWGTYHDSSRVPTPSMLLPTDKQTADLAEAWQTLNAINQKIAATKRDLFADGFSKWKANFDFNRGSPTPVRQWNLDALQDGNKFANQSSDDEKTDGDNSVGSTSSANKLVPGVQGQALQLTGDDAASFPTPGNLSPWERYSISCWLKIPNDLESGLIVHRQSGTDVGSFGTELSLRDGKLFFAKIRFWPGNAMAVQTTKKILTDQWIHVVATNDGHGKAAGMKLYVNGVADFEVIRDQLTKDPGAGGSGLTVGQKFRAPGFKNGTIDEIKYFDFPVSAVEARQIFAQVTPVNRAEFSERELKAHFLGQQDSFVRLQRERAAQFQRCLQLQTGVSEISVMEEMEQPRPAHVLHRGAYDAPRTNENLATRTTLSALPAMDDQLPRNRMGLARWATSDDHPLTSRVAVNRHWQMFFGIGLVTTPEDFGVQGSVPTHERLLDWLARDFVDSGWDVKRLCKQIVLSATYRQTSRCGQELRARDPDNLLLARGPSKRLTAEMIRDLALFASELLVEQAGGPPVSPYQPEKLWRENNSMTPAYQQSVGKGLYRRSLYSVWKRTTPLPNMLSFDATSREVCSVKRSETNTPLQALVLLNDVQFVEAARVLATKAIDTHDQVDDRVSAMFIRLTGRDALPAELDLLARLYKTQRETFVANPERATELVSIGESKPGDPATHIELAATTVVAQTILSLDAAIWSR